MNYDINDLMGEFTYEYRNGEKVEPYTEAWADESAMIVHMLLDETLWTREAHYVFNKGSKFEDSGEGIVVFVNCNDVFAWGCADAEELPHDEVVNLFMEWHKSNRWGPVRWVCFRRNEKPQAPVARDMKAAGAWDERMEALPDNRYDAFLRKRKEQQA